MHRSRNGVSSRSFSSTLSIRQLFRVAHVARPPHVDSTLVQAIARAFGWQRVLEDGRYATIKEIAQAEKANSSYVSRVLRLTLLAPQTVEAILDGRADGELKLAEAMAPYSVAWAKQAATNFGRSRARNRHFDLQEAEAFTAAKLLGGRCRPIERAVLQALKRLAG